MLSNALLDAVGVPIILCNSDGNVKKVNPAAKWSLNKMLGSTQLDTIMQIDPNFMSLRPLDNENRQIILKNLQFQVTVLKTEFAEEDCYLYLFPNSVATSEEFDTILDLIDDAIAITDKNGVIEKFNQSFYSLSGISLKGITGTYMCDRAGEVLYGEPVTLRVLREKKPMSMNMTYKNGTIITFTAIPQYDKSGEITRVVGTGRDVTKLIELEAKLREVEKVKDEYQRRLDEIGPYFGLNEVVLSSAKMEEIMRMAMKASRTDSPVFITGESGVGKEVIARFIHNNSPRKEKPFVAINCAAIPPDLLESEFFGYEEGAFTGAKKSGQRGLLDQAKGGTVFLDEIGEFPYKMQSKLLRVIQEQSYIRVGGSENIATDVRYIAATNLTKAELKDSSRFRQDLYYRLSVVPLHIPPLRERREDILPLIHHHLRQNNLKYNRNVSVTKPVIERLYKYNWPGNVRELKNLIERLVILAESDTVSEEDSLWIQQLGRDEQQGLDISITINKLVTLKKASETMEAILIKQALEEQGSVAKAAKILGVNPSTIHRMLHRN